MYLWLQTVIILNRSGYSLLVTLIKRSWNIQYLKLWTPIQFIHDGNGSPDINFPSFFLGIEESRKVDTKTGRHTRLNFPKRREKEKK